MNAWNAYASRIGVVGDTKREILYNRESKKLVRELKTSLSYFEVMIDDLPQSVGIINSDNLNEKYIYSLPGEDIHCGAIVQWMDNHWLVTEKDANTEVYTRAKLEQCNYLLKWVNDEDKICERWCVVEDGTKLKHAA